MNDSNSTALLSMQEVFDKAAAHLLKQGKRAVSYSNSTGCRYKTDDGLKCAVGCLIPDELYSEELEGRHTRAISDTLEKIIDVNQPRMYEFLNSLQVLHDYDEPLTWRAELSKLAARYGLDMI